MQFRTIKSEDADEVLFVLREYMEVICKAEAEFTRQVEAGVKKMGEGFAKLAEPIQRANDIKVKKIQRAIEIMTLGSEG